MWVAPDFETKKGFKEAITRGEEVYVFGPGIYTEPVEGVIDVKGPMFSEPPTWHAKVLVENTMIIKIIS